MNSCDQPVVSPFPCPGQFEGRVVYTALLVSVSLVGVGSQLYFMLWHRTYCSVHLADKKLAASNDYFHNWWIFRFSDWSSSLWIVSKSRSQLQFSSFLFCLTTSIFSVLLNSLNIMSIEMIENREKHLILTLRTLKPANISHFYLNFDFKILTLIMNQ